MQASFTLSQWVKICQQDCTLDGSLTPICRGLKLDNRSRNFENMVFFFSIRKQGQKTKLRAFSHLENRRKLAVLRWTVSLTIVKQCSKQWDVFTTSVLVNKVVPVKRSGY